MPINSGMEKNLEICFFILAIRQKIHSSLENDVRLWAH